MSILTIIQLILSLLIVISGFYVVLAQNIVRAAFSLFFVLFLMAGSYLCRRSADSYSFWSYAYT